MGTSVYSGSGGQLDCTSESVLFLFFLSLLLFSSSSSVFLSLLLTTLLRRRRFFVRCSISFSRVVARAAHSSEGGRFVIALRSTTRSGKSKIVSTLARGAGVVTPRTLTQYVITEYGIGMSFVLIRA
jgi:hypothetical protein